ncbi:hypothetical protein ScPMuIL_008307 [Solemya velum]
MPTYKLIYFEAKGRAELTRLVFAAGGVKYEDKRIDRIDDWPKVKATMPQETLPVLEVDGKRLSQAMTIARYIGRQCGLVGKSLLEQAEVDCILDTCTDVLNDYPKIIQEEDIAKKKIAYKKMMESRIPTTLDYCEKTLAANAMGKGYLVGSALTLADLALYDIMQYPIDVLGIQLDKHPKVKAHRKKVADIPKVAEYLKRRPTYDLFESAVLGPIIKQCKTTHYKLTYFLGRGRGELTRLVFAASGINYDDCRVDFKQWADLKPKTPLGQIPVLEVDGKPIVQSMAIARFVGREAGLMGKNNWEQGQIEMAMDSLNSMFNDVAGWYFEKDESLKDEKKTKLVDDTIPPMLTMLESMLTKNATGKGYLVGSCLSVADLALYAGLQYPIDFFAYSLNKYPKVDENRKMIAEIPRIADWLKKRPVTEL